MNEPKKSGNINIFAPGWHYRFTPPIETSCVAVDRMWHRTRKCFKFGEYIQLEQDADGELMYIFKGLPIDGTVDHYFFVRLRETGLTRIIASHLRLVR